MTMSISSSSVGVQGISASVQERVRTLLPGGVWGTVGKPPARDAFCFEALQAAHYAPGEHFLAHEDAFPTVMLPETGFQRRATVLVYLNDCTAGGRTAFEALDGVSVQPAAGRALLFYPAFKDGTPDARTLHSGGDAGDEKWVVQQWVACGTKGAKATPLGLGGMGPGLTSRPGKSLSSLMGGKARFCAHGVHWLRRLRWCSSFCMAEPPLGSRYNQIYSSTARATLVGACGTAVNA